MVIGNKRAATLLRNALSSERGHAFLLSGPIGVGKQALAQQLIAEKLGRPLKENDPDILMLDIEGAHIGREDVAPITHHLSRRPIIGKFNIVILLGAQRLTPEAANSLLVLLENPPATALLFLTTTSLGAVLSTIRSRCVPVVFGTVAQEEIARGLKQLFPEQTESTIARCAELARGLPGEAISLLNDPRKLLAAEERSRTVNAWVSGGLTERLDIAKQLGDDGERTLQFLAELVSGPAQGWYAGALTAERQLLRNVQPRAVLEAFAMLEV
jgi:DNA polymerase III delta prime subunit